MPRKYKLGDTVLVPRGHNGAVKATVLEVWDDRERHMRVRLEFDDADEDEDPSIILTSPSGILPAA